MFAFKARAYVNTMDVIWMQTTLTSVDQGYKLHGNTWYVISSKNVS